MDLGTIKSKLNTNVYRMYKEFLTDMDQYFITYSEFSSTVNFTTEPKVKSAKLAKQFAKNGKS